MSNALSFDAFALALSNAFDARITYEINEQTNSENKVEDFLFYKKDFSRKSVIEQLLASNVSPNFMNVHEVKTSRINVKMTEKVSDIADVLSGASRVSGFKRFQHTRFMLLTIDNFNKNGERLSSKENYAPMSKDSAKLKDNARNKLVVRNSANYGLTTQNAQKSTSIQALRAFNIIRCELNDEREVCYSVNFDNDASQALLDLCAIA